jgi:tetratricopeptide (TPR) repeat protein
MNRSWRCWVPGVKIFLILLTCFELVRDVSAVETTKPKTLWVSGRVVTPRGEPIEEATVQFEINSMTGNSLKIATNLRGEFHAEIKLKSAKAARLQGTIFAGKAGYRDGRETLDLGINDYTDGTTIILHELTENPNQLSMAALIGALVPPLRNDAEGQFTNELHRNEFRGGCEELLSQRNTGAAVSRLTTSLGRASNCLECRLLLSLALLNAGSWDSANKQLEQASKANDANSAQRPEPALLMGVMKAWWGHSPEAIPLLLRAIEIDPKNVIALQELGRTYVSQKDWKAADSFLSKALEAGAGGYLRILRVRSLMELGDVAEAEREMIRYAAGRETKDLPLEVRILSIDVQRHLNLLAQKHVPAVTVQSPEELIKTIPALDGLKISDDQSMLEEILKKTGEGVSVFFKSIPNISSLEKVHQAKLDKDGKLKASMDQNFNYILVTDNRNAGVGIKEYRTNSDGNDSSISGLKKGLMLTSGFTSGFSHFHPDNWNGSDFRYLGTQLIDDRETYVVAFAQKASTAKVMRYIGTNLGSSLVLVHGLAWIDTQTFHIIRFHTFLLNVLPLILQLTTEIDYKPVLFTGNSDALWLPNEVKIMMNWHDSILRNQHLYSDYRLFSVETKEERKPVSKTSDAPPQE